MNEQKKVNCIFFRFYFQIENLQNKKLFYLLMQFILANSILASLFKVYIVAQFIYPRNKSIFILLSKSKAQLNDFFFQVLILTNLIFVLRNLIKLN